MLSHSIGSQIKSATCDSVRKIIGRIISTERLSPENSIAIYFPNTIRGTDLSMLLRLPEVKKIIFSAGSISDEMMNGNKIIILNDKTWTPSGLTQSGGCLLILGKTGDVRFRTLMQLYLAGFRSLYFAGEDLLMIRQIAMYKLLLKRGASACSYFAKGILRRGLIFLLHGSAIRFFGELYYKSKIQRFIFSFSTSLYRPVDFEDKKVHYFIGSLRPGGAERQMSNTVLGMLNNWNVVVSCEYYDSAEDRFYGTPLEAKGIIVNKLHKTEQDHLLEHKLDQNGTYRFFNSLIEGKLSSFERSIIPYVLALLESKPRVVHAWLDQVNIRAGLAALIVGVPKIILSQRNVAPDNFLLYTPVMRPGYLALIKSPRVILLNNSHAGATDYSRWLGITSDQITVVHNGFNQAGLSFTDDDVRQFRTKYHIPHNVPVMGSVFRFYEEKRPLFWLEIARKVLDSYPETWFVLVGEGILLEKVKQMAAEFNMADRTIFTGVMKNPLHAVKAMDVFVLSSRKEGLPNVLIEAQSVGVPVVTPYVGGAAETLLEGITGYAIKNATTSDMADKVVKVLKDQEFRDKVKQIGPEFISEKFGLETMIKNTLAVYDVE